MKHLNSANGRCAAKVGWSEARDEMNMLPEEQRGNADIKFFSRYALCARGLRDFEAEAGLPYFSFDACHSYHPYYRGTYGNAVALVDTKRESLTNCAFALSTDDSENTGLYTALFDIIKDGENESPLIELMKKESSVVISDDSTAFRGAARQELGNDRRFATCSWHMMYNAKKKGKGWDEKTLFWPYQGARTEVERAARWAELGEALPPSAFESLRTQKVKEENGEFSWTLLKHIDAGMCMFGRDGSNNPVEQQHALQLKNRGQNPYVFVKAWCKEVTKVEGKILEAAQMMKDNDAILTPWASRMLQESVDERASLQLDVGVIIEFAEAVMVTEEVDPNVFVQYAVNLEKRTCGCAHWQWYGVACKHAILVWEKYQEQLAQRNGVEMEADEYLEKRALFAVGEHQPYFLAKVFIEAAAKHLANDRRIRLPCESTYEFDINKYPPMPLPKLKHGQRQSSRGRPNENRFVRAPNAKRCGVCQRYGHNERTCEYYEVWFDWKDPNDLLFRNMFSRFLNGNRNRARRAQ